MNRIDPQRLEIAPFEPIVESGYPKNPSELEIVTALDSRLCGNNGTIETLCHIRPVMNTG